MSRTSAPLCRKGSPGHWRIALDRRGHCQTPRRRWRRGRDHLQRIARQGAGGGAGSILVAGGRAIAIEADAGHPGAVRAAVAATVAELERLHILVNNAGIALGGPITEIAFADYERMIAVNVTGVFVATQEAVRHMPAGGRVIHIGSSMARYAAFGGASVYTLTKGAVAGFNRSLVRDLGPRGITVNTVHPGPTDTDMNPDGGPVSKIVGPGMAIGRYGRPEEIAGAVAYLAGPDAAFITGAELMADGGFTA